MSTVRGPEPLSFRRLPPSGFNQLEQLDLSHAARFLEPLAAILDVVRARPAHHLSTIQRQGRLAGFYVVHPDRRDAACWWLGWLAIDRAHQGQGLGRAALAAALSGLARLARIRRIRLLVAPGNAPALRLYQAAGFKPVGTWPHTGERVMEWTAPATTRPDAVTIPALTLVLAMLMRLYRRGVPPAARMSGEFHGPPDARNPADHPGRHRPRCPSGRTPAPRHRARPPRLTMRLYRLGTTRHPIWDGAGAARHGGRWNPLGTHVIYAAGSLALAMLERMVQRGELAGTLLIEADVPGDVPWTDLLAAPPLGWRALGSPEAVAAGHAWLEAGQTALLRVPSAIVPREPNWMINPSHPDADRIGVKPPEILEWDPRLFGIPSPPQGEPAALPLGGSRDTSPHPH